MSKDIRSFFTVISKKSGTDSKKNNPHPVSLSKKKSKKLVDSDDEDIIAGTPQKKPLKKVENTPIEILSSSSENEATTKKKKKSKQSDREENGFSKLKPTSEEVPVKHTQEKKSVKRPLVILSSDSEEESAKSKSKTLKENTPKLKPAKVEDVFKNVPIKQSKVEFTPKPTPEKKSEGKQTKSKSKKKTSKTELEIHSDPALENTLLGLDDDDDFFEKNIDALEQSILEVVENNESKPATFESAENNTDNKSESSKGKKEIGSKTGERKRSRTDSSGDTNTPKKKKIEHTDSGIDPDQERHERRRHSAVLYQKYLNRGAPKNHGKKELPKGKQDCLSNLCFLKTGVLDSLESEEFESLVKSHGGRTVQAVSKKVNYVVVGDDPGPAKLAKAESYGIKTISEDELLDMILVKSGMEAKYCKKDTSLSSEDLGIEVDSKEEKSPPHNDSVNKSKVKTYEENTSPYFSSAPSTSKAPDMSWPIETVQKTAEVTSDITIVQTTPQVDPSALPFTEKYRPTDLRRIIGQGGSDSCVNRLQIWLQNWFKNRDRLKNDTTFRLTPYSPHGAFYKCALLSGPPGVGKTTTATLVAKVLGLDIVEFNASDTRSKRLLHEEVANLLMSKTIAAFATGKPEVSKNRVLLMDEVDGMAGNEDRGGIQELIQLIKKTSIPIICMCNDRNHQKIRSLVQYCYDLRFHKPDPDHILGPMKTICFKEKIDIPSPAMLELIKGAGCDIRQIINQLSLLKVDGKVLNVENAKNEAQKAKKDCVMGPWEVCRKVFSSKDHETMSLTDKANLYYKDYSLGPLFVQENYMKAKPVGIKNTKEGYKKLLLKVALAADSLSRADVVDAKMRSMNNWSLMESLSIFYSVLPGYHMSGQIDSINFPSWLGKNSRRSKFNRILGELHTHIRSSTLASKMAVRLDYLVHLKNAIVRPLRKGLNGVNKAVTVMEDYKLLREDYDSLLELCQWKHNYKKTKDVIDSKVKTAFTRAYNKRVPILPYAPSSGVSKKKSSTVEADMYGNEDEVEESDDEKEDDISKNAMIKVKQVNAKGKKVKAVAGTSKAKESKKGKGKK